MLAIIGAAMALLYAFGVGHGWDFHLGWFGIAFIGAGIAFGWVPWHRGA